MDSRRPAAARTRWCGAWTLPPRSPGRCEFAAPTRKDAVITIAYDDSIDLHGHAEAAVLQLYEELITDWNTRSGEAFAAQAGEWRISLFQNTPAQFHGRPDLVERLTRELREATL